MDDRLVILVDEGLGNSSYILDLGDRRALVLDASRDPGPYLAAAERKGLVVAYAAETHLHADFVSGSRELAATGAKVLAAAAGRLEFPHRGFGHGDEIDLGGLMLRALATPGHTPEHLAYLVLDGARPLALFSGGALIVDGVARTDLIDPERSEELARALWRSLHEQILTLPDDLPVYPTHGAGSFCSAPGGAERTTTIGREKRANPLLAAPDEDAFVARLFGGLGSFPDYFLRLREVNRRGPRVYGPAPSLLAALPPDEVGRLLQDGARVIDARPIEAFAAGHIPGALSIALRSSFGTWLGWLVEPEVPLVFVMTGEQDRVELVRQALKVGYERLAGELSGGIEAWRAAGRPTRHIGLVSVADVGDHVLDVRQTAEFTAGHVPDAVHVELGDLRRGRLKPDGGTTVVMCDHGQRAMTGASLLEADGHDGLSVALGSAQDWAVAHRRRLATGR
jgi:glyoxylase-like metal-dependent hydrolase (beta-lactamase superfamily II)/rhodanese-related sulfurtransferase